MSVIRIDGFDGYGTPSDQTNFANRMYSAGWSGDGFNMACVNTTRTGIGFAIATGFYGNAMTAFDAASSVVSGFAFNPGSLGFRRIVFCGYDNYMGSVTYPVQIYQTPTGALSFFQGPNFPGALIGHSPVNTIYANTWHYVELKWNAGSLEVRVDGNTVFTATATPVAPTVNLFGFMSQGVGQPSVSFDDFYLLNNDGAGLTDFLGDCVVHTLFPLADAGPNSTSQFGGGVTHASAVNGLPRDESSAYLYSNASGQEELFTTTELPSDMIDILALQVNVRAKKDSAGVAQYSIALKSGATLSLSSAKTPTTSFLELHKVWETDPNGGAWTKVSAQAANIGFKVV
jgi:hypothetical protein